MLAAVRISTQSSTVKAEFISCPTDVEWAMLHMTGAQSATLCFICLYYIDHLNPLRTTMLTPCTQQSLI